MEERTRPADLIPRGRISIAVHPSLRGSLSRLGGGRALVIGYFASARCGAIVGDLSVSWRTATPGARFRRLGPLEGVDLWADTRLLEVLETAAPELRPPSIFKRGTPRLTLGLPERWLEFLEQTSARR